MTPEDIKQWTRKNLVMVCALRPEQCLQENLQPYWIRRSELSVNDGCLLWGSRVVVPLPRHKKIKEELHVTHPGIVLMKALARSYFWWLGIDMEMEFVICKCHRQHLLFNLGIIDLCWGHGSRCIGDWLTFLQ